MKRGQEGEKHISVLPYNENMVVVDLKDQLLQPYLLEREKVAIWYIRMFRRIFIGTILNCMIICLANSGQSIIDNFKFRVDLVLALLMEHRE
jgi:hypothetical protein